MTTFFPGKLPSFLCHCASHLEQLGSLRPHNLSPHIFLSCSRGASVLSQSAAQVWDVLQAMRVRATLGGQQRPCGK